MVVKKDDVRVSVCMVTYNQKKYIAQAIESVLMQKTNFKFQLLIGDDASTDGTTEIVREYAEKYPDIIKPIFHEKNEGPFNNSRSLYCAAKTEFVAILDGDDYWTDEHKLQDQIDFLDTNKSFNICCSLTEIIFPNDLSKPIIFPSEKKLNKKIWTFEDLGKDEMPFHTSSVVYRWRFYKEDITPYFSKPICPGDRMLVLLHTEKNGYLGFINKVYSVYRSCIGISTEIFFDELRVFERYSFLILDYYNEIRRIFNYRLDPIVYQKKKEDCFKILKAFEKISDFSSLEKMKNEYPEYYYLARSGEKNNNSILTLSDNNKNNSIFKRIKRISHLVSCIFILQLLTSIGAIIWLTVK